VKPWNTFVALCGYLRAGLLGAVAPSPAADNSWDLLVEASSHHYVTPALAWCLRGQVGIPSEVGDYFDAALTLNGQRNERLTAALVRIVAALNAIDIEPILLKGAARLVDGIYPAPKLRFLGDLDILIPADRSAEAVAALERIGFDEHDPPFDHHHHHLPMLHERDTGAGVELHTKLTLPPYDAIISAAWFSENTKSFQLQDRRVRLPDATRSAAHTIVHDQLLHLNYQSNRVQLRQLLDLAMVRARYESTIDWTELDHRFCSVGMGQVLATYLEFAKVLLGQPTPQLSHVPRAGALADFRRMIEPPSVLRHLAKVARMYVSARRRDPLGVLRLIRPRTWSIRIRQVKTRLGKAKW
jgi:Uncharacterised nucleotidyltransferase